MIVCPDCATMFSVGRTHQISEAGEVTPKLFCHECGFGDEFFLDEWNEPGITLWLKRSGWAELLKILARFEKRVDKVPKLIARIRGTVAASPVDGKPIGVEVSPERVQWILSTL